MMDIKISAAVGSKLLYKHGVLELEVAECFENWEGNFLIDDREQHRRYPPTLWFIAETAKKRLLKVVFQQRGESSHVITVYEPNSDEIRIYEANAGGIK